MMNEEIFRCKNCSHDVVYRFGNYHHADEFELEDSGGRMSYHCAVVLKEGKTFFSRLVCGCRRPEPDDEILQKASGLLNQSTAEKGGCSNERRF